MNRVLPLAMAAALLATGCGGGGPGKVKGKVVENGQPTTFPAMQASVQLAPVGSGGKADWNGPVYTAVLNADGTFEVVASGGEVPPGEYLIAIEQTGKPVPRLANFTTAKTAVKREIKSGSNELTIDLAKPEG
jgi:hypothetical protein